MQYTYIFSIIFGLLPSIAWTAFYLRKDIHPEPKKWLILVFAAGMSITPFVAVVEWLLADVIDHLILGSQSYVPELISNFFAIIFIFAFIEEFFKFLVVWLIMKHNPVFDEPEDAMIYMIVAALGFAAVENIIVMHSFSPVYEIDLLQPLFVLGIRSFGATFLHALASAIVGFYYALSLCRIKPCNKNPYTIIAKGLLIASLLHGFFNYFVAVMNENLITYLCIPLMIIAIFTLNDFKILQGISPKKFKN